MASFYNSLSSLPSAKTEYSVEFNNLRGGLNLEELDYRLKADESPLAQNLMWVNGVLGSRDGQSWRNADTARGKGYTCYSRLFWDYSFHHIGDALYYAPPGETVELTAIQSGVPEVRGTFFRYDEFLYYKTTGGYYKITYNPDTPATPFSCESVVGYVPIILINADPATAAGDTYQPENRISAEKIVWYNATANRRSYLLAGDGSATVFPLEVTAAAGLSDIEAVYVDGTLQSTAAYTFDVATGKVTFTTAPASGATIQVDAAVLVNEYYLPVAADEILSVTVDGVEQTAGTDYTVAADGTHITFAAGHYPPVTFPATNNTVKIHYSAANPDAMRSVMDCRYAEVYGGDSGVCVVLAGSSAQPNAYFWSGNNIAMDVSYFPVEHYNLAGDANEAISGFGKQQSYLMVFKERSIGRALFGMTTVGERVRITMDYTPTNSTIGCDLPWSIQLVENNLVFCNSATGAYYVSNTSAAYENNILPLSIKINGSVGRPGLLHDVRQVDADEVCSADNADRYWLVANGNAYVWDYTVSDHKDPSWFFQTNINAVAFHQSRTLFGHLDGSGRLTEFERSFSDYGEAIDKRFRFAVQHFGSYDRLKDVTRVIFTVRSDTDTSMSVDYVCDYGEWADYTPIESFMWRLAPRNLAYRNLAVHAFATVAVRMPGLKHVRHFTMDLSNNINGQDMSIVSAQIFYKYQGRDR